MPTGNNTVYGPVQVNSTILNTDAISSQFTLLNQQGSRVVQGSLQLIPIDDSLLYIRPIYVVSASQKQPAFRFVVVFYAGKAVIATTVEKALVAVPGRSRARRPPTPDDADHAGRADHDRRTAPETETAASLLNQATKVYNDAQDALKAGDFAKYGELSKQLGDAARPGRGGAERDRRRPLATRPARRRPRRRPPRSHDDVEHRGRRVAGAQRPPLRPPKNPGPPGLFGAGGIVTIYVVEIPGRPPGRTLDPRSSRMAVKGIDLGKYQLGWSDTENYVYKPKKGVNADVVKDISWHKSEPDWMTKWRLNALKRFERKPMLEWFSKNMPDIDFDDIYYYIKPTEGVVDNWDMLPDEMKNTYEKLGIPEAERKFLAGVTSQYESEVVYHKNRDDLAEKGILFTSMDQALIDYPDLVKEHLGTVIPPGDNKFAALNSAVWSGGSFIYVPPGVHVDMPLQAYFRINAENAGQFERTLIIADEGSSVHYVEGCSAPV